MARYAIMILLVLESCSTSEEIWLRKKDPRSFKDQAYQHCGHDYTVLRYEKDMALIQCLSSE